MPARPRALGALVALFTAGYLAPYLLPTLVGRLSTGLALSTAQAGLIGSILLLGSAGAGFVLASRGRRVDPRRAARLGLLAMALGYGTAAASGTVTPVVAGAVLGGFGSGTATAVAAAGIAGRPDPHRAATLGLLGVSATAGVLYLSLPHLGGGHALPFAAIAAAALLTYPATSRLPVPTDHHPDAPREHRAAPLPHRRAGLVLAASILCWSMAQNALWGVSGRIGLTRAGLTEVTLGLVFAVALGAGLAGVTAAGALGHRLGRVAPIAAGTPLIALCVLLSSSAEGPYSFATGEILWNAVYPVVLSHLLGLAASLDPSGRWAVLVGAASSLGVACGPFTGSTLAQTTGYPGMGVALCALLLLVAAPMTAVARQAAGRPVLRGRFRAVGTRSHSVSAHSSPAGV
ncbi:MFS transporter [Streptomyces sp. NPDC093111]|uniref:MFS transporter n=1 Tax=Streptomyces sp. NPDC093111 TaxID=3154978 RepID=UPI0034497382